VAAAYRQHSLKNAVSLSGIGLHSGRMITVCLRPAPVNTGIVFRRIDLTPVKNIKICHDKIAETSLCSRVEDEGVQIQTIEHLLSALAGKEIDNVFVEVDQDEIPVLDGSAAPFLFLISAAGIVEQDAVRQVVKIKKAIRVSDGDKFVELLPCSHYRLEISIDFEHPVIAQQSIAFDFSPSAYSKEVSRARTFGMADQIEALHEQGLALGASLNNAIGLSKEGIMNQEGLRARDEFVRHKLLDAIGDLYVAGPIQGLFRAHKPSHALNHRLLATLFADPSAWETI
jgi:UDP-3-O-[3-hydroxymyristoyl] N-acetylglucosamine deacetylase